MKTKYTLNGTTNLTQQDIQTPSRFVREENVETKPTTKQQSISPISPTILQYSVSTNNITIDH